MSMKLYCINIVVKILTWMVTDREKWRQSCRPEPN